MIGIFVRNPVFANLLAGALIVGGLMAVFQLPRETLPETAIDFVAVTVPYPGATAEDVEQSICIKIEQALEGIPGQRELASFSSEDGGKVVVEYIPSVISTFEVLRQIQDRVNSITTFPKESERPIIEDVLIRNPVINVGIFGDAPERTIKENAEHIRKQLLFLPEVSQVSLSGIREYEISITVTEETLKRYSLTLQQVMNAVATGSLDLPAGTVRTRHEEITVRTIGQRYSAQAFEDLVVIARPDGTTLRLGQIAQVRDSFEEMPIYGMINGKPGALITVFKTGREDISEIASAVREFVKVQGPQLPEGISLTVWGDESRDVDARIAMLVKNGLMGIALVVVCLLLFLESSFSFAVALGIPVSFAGALVVMALGHNTLNMISLLGLLMGTGIIVDDAIVIAESVYAQTRRGLSPMAAAVEGTRVVALPVLTSSATTIVAFVPLMFVDGVMGKLIHVLPVVVIATIAASAVEAFVILPAHLCEWASSRTAKRSDSWRNRIRRGLESRLESLISGIYRRWFRKALSGRLVLLGGTIACVLATVGLVIGGRTAFVLFPKMDANSLRARVRFPEGIPVDVSAAAVARIEQAAKALNHDPALETAQAGDLVQNIYSVVGEWPDYLTERGSSLSEVSLELMPAELRRVDMSVVEEHWRRGIGEIPGAVSVSITRRQLGPTDKPMEIRLLGLDLEELRSAADEVVAQFYTYEGVFDVTDDLRPGKRELRVSLKPTAAALGITVADLSAQLRQGLYGGEAVRLQRGLDEVKVMVSYADADRLSLSAIENMRIRTKNGAEIPFHEVAQTELVRGYSVITRQSGLRRVRIHADLDERFANAERIISDMAANFLPGLRERFPGVTPLIDGQRKRIEESMSSLRNASVIAAVVMYGLLGTVLRSYFQPMIIMAAIPLGMVGAVVGHTLLGYDITLMSIFGMVALAGIVVNDSLVLVDFVNQRLAEGSRLFEAVAAAGEARFRAVVLTSMTTALGLLPLLTERSSQAQALIPLAVSIAFGLIFATVLTLFIVPALILLMDDMRRFVHWLRYGGTFPAPDTIGAPSTPRDGTTCTAPTESGE
ncbi:MAG: efflux RND transporter permease subunit [Planctomycetes bacterium]|nr:efflux RND transporter permease subunit [Planctomycetota bacterium]